MNSVGKTVIAESTGFDRSKPTRMIILMNTASVQPMSNVQQLMSLPKLNKIMPTISPHPKESVNLSQSQ